MMSNQPTECANVVRASCAGLFAVLIVLGVVGSTNAEPFPPFDKADEEPDFVVFRADLIEIAKARDFKALKDVMHPDIVTGFGYDPGWETAIEVMVKERSRWDTLLDVLGKGGKFRMEGNAEGEEVKAFYAPYSFFAEIPGADAMIVAEKEVKAYAEPSTKSKVMATLKHEALAVVFGDRADNQTWIEVKLPDGRNAFVEAGAVRVDGDARVGFIKHDGKWTMHVFIGNYLP